MRNMSPHQNPNTVSFQSALKTLVPRENHTIGVSLPNCIRSSSLTNRRFHSVERSLQVS